MHNNEEKVWKMQCVILHLNFYACQLVFALLTSVPGNTGQPTPPGSSVSTFEKWE